MAVFIPLNQVEKIQTQMERSKAKFWWISDSDNTLIAENEEDSSTLDDSFNSLVDVLENLEGDWVYVTIRNKIPNKDEFGNFKRGANIKGIQKFEYRVRLKQAPGAGGSGRMQGINGFGAPEMLQGLYLQIGDLKAEMIRKESDAKIAALEEKLKQKKEGSTTDKLIDAVADKFVKAWNLEVTPGDNKTPVAENTTTTPAAPAGPKLTEEEQKKKSGQLSQNLKDLGAVLGPQTYTFLNDLAERAKQNPDFFKLFAEKSINKELNLKDLIK